MGVSVNDDWEKRWVDTNEIKITLHTNELTLNTNEIKMTLIITLMS